MAETKRMTAEQVVSYLMEEDGLDFLRESLTWVVQQLMEAEVSELVGAGARRAGAGGAADASQRVPGPVVGDAGGRDRARDPEDPPRQLLPVVPRAASTLRAGAGRGRAGGLRRRRLDPEGRPGRRVARAADLQERGLADLRRASTSRSRRSATGRLEGRYPYLWLDAKVEKVRDGGRVVAQGAGARLRRARVRLPRGDRPRRRRGRDRGVLAQLPARPGRARPDRRAARRHRRPRRAEEGDRRRCSAAPGSAAPSTSSAKRSGTPAATSSRCSPR